MALTAATTTPIMARMLTTTASATTSRISSIRFSPKTLSSKLTFSSFSFSSNKSQAKRFTTSRIKATISTGDKLPESTLSYLDSAGELQTTTVSELTKGKKTVLFAVPGAFTPTCSQKHLPGFVEKSSELKSKGVDTIACISVDDAFVMKAWKEDLKNGDEVLLLSDGNGDFTRALGVELDLSDKPIGLGVRSRRYALLADDGVVKVLNLEEGGAFENSSETKCVSIVSVFDNCVLNYK